MLKELNDISTLLRQEWSDPLIKTTDGTVLTKKDVFQYYNNPIIRKKLLSHLQGKPTIVIQSFAPGNDILRRNDDKGKEIKISKPSGSVFDPSSLDYWIERRLSEAHVVMGKNTDIYVVDIDPKDNVPWEETKDVTKQVSKALDILPEVKNTNIYYSGGRGFHIIASLNKSIPIDKARENVKSILSYFGPMGYSTQEDSPIRLDLAPMKNKGSFRAPYSLNASTGYVSIPVGKNELDDFEKSYASISHFNNPNLKFLPQRP